MSTEHTDAVVFQPGQWYVMDRFASSAQRAYVAGPFATRELADADRRDWNIGGDCDVWQCPDDAPTATQVHSLTCEVADAPQLARQCPSCGTGYLGGYAGMRCTNGACDRPIVVECAPVDSVEIRSSAPIAGPTLRYPHGSSYPSRIVPMGSNPLQLGDDARDDLRTAIDHDLDPMIRRMAEFFGVADPGAATLPALVIELIEAAAADR